MFKNQHHINEIKLDTRPLSATGQAETREYMAIAVLDDEQVGQQSDIVSVVFGG